jgi:hypothetical protein
MTRSEFSRLYADTLRERALSDPEYQYAAADADRTAAVMLPSIASGRADIHGSPVLRALARRLGVPHTLAGWRAFASSLVDA